MHSGAFLPKLAGPVGVVLTVLVWPSLAPAQGAARQFLGAMDFNKDGYLSRSEWRGAGSWRSRCLLT